MNTQDRDKIPSVLVCLGRLHIKKPAGYGGLWFRDLMSYKPKDLVDCIDRYGPINYSSDKKLFWPNESDWIKGCYLPVGVTPYLKNSATGKPVERIYCNVDIHEPLLTALDAVLTAGCQSEFRTFDGCYNVRYIRGSTSVLSMHSYGIALDFNAATNPLGGRSSWSDPFIRCWTDNGWIWGGDFKLRKDPQHYQWVGVARQQMKLAS